MRVYIGGPMFSEADITYNRIIRDSLLESGFEVYCPSDNLLINDKTSKDITGEKIYLYDIQELKNCNVFLCRITLDCGTMWEAGYMDCLHNNVNSKKYLGCIGLVTDIRLETLPDPNKSGVDNQTMYIDQFVVGGLKLSLGLYKNIPAIQKRLLELSHEVNNEEIIYESIL